MDDMTRYVFKPMFTFPCLSPSTKDANLQFKQIADISNIT